MECLLFLAGVVVVVVKTGRDAGAAVRKGILVDRVAEMVALEVVMVLFVVVDKVAFGENKECG